ncbi:MAG: methyl-accepting chemotaxis protein [Desulfobacteraceae bacterium]|nr:MAG: methyl-accepting chemotaxis protein [Desulfobacteraceae bacterium]
MVKMKKNGLRTKFLTAFLLVGLIPFSVVGILSLVKTKAALSRQAFNQLDAVRDIKKNQIEQYIATLRNQIITFSEDQMVVESMLKFKQAFNGFIEENSLAEDEIGSMKEKLKTYYTGEYAAEYEKRNPGGSPDIERIFTGLDNPSIALQYHYIRANENPLGSKDALIAASDKSKYSKLHAEIHPILRSYLSKFGYYDIFLVDAETGDILYSVFKELDYTTSLLDGPYAKTHLGEAFRKANGAKDKDACIVTDFSRYLPSYDAPAGFIASPVFHGSEKIGVAIFQFPIDRLNEIMTQRAGMGKSGETYLVGPDRLMRSDSYLDPKSRSVIASFTNPKTGSVDTQAVKEALGGKTDAKIISDYNGHPVLSAYTPLKVGDFCWALIAEIDKAEAFEAIITIERLMAIIAVAGIAGIVIVALLFTGSITKPIQKGVEFAEALSKGDLTRRLDIEREDEIGALVKSLNQMGSDLNGILRDIIQGVETLSSSSTELSAISQQMAAGAEQTSGKSNTVAAAAEELSANMTNVAAASEQTSNNVQMVATAAEQMSSTIDEISGNTEKSRNITEEAVSQASDASKKVDELGNAAREIGKVTEAIADISGQTNLLSLNATIEAARAGEAGKGFAVVANEIKELARQTAEATQEISQRIGSIQSTVEDTVSSIGQITRIINDVNEIVNNTATAVEQQSTTTKEIAGNVAHAAQGIQDVNQNVAQSSRVAGDISKDISEVSQAAQEMSNGSSQVNASAVELSKLAERLNDMVSRFKV